jgi:iron complex outermembrane receptor protein
MVSGNVLRGEGGGQISLPSLTMAPPFDTRIEDDIRLSGSNILTRWTKVFEDASSINLQVYYDHFDRQEALGRYKTDSVDFDFQHDLQLTGSQRFLWGVGYRANSDAIETRTPFVLFSGDSLRTSILNLMVQDDIALIRDDLVLTLGAKFERNSYSGWETQPSATLIWNRSSSSALWGSLSRAVRIPSRYNRDVQADFFGFPTPMGIPGVVRLAGAPEPRAESLVSYQLGYRTSPLPSLTVDLAAFVNRYDDVFGQVDEAPFVETSRGFPLLIRPLRSLNALQGTTRGVEAQATYRVLDRWQLSGSGSWLNAALRPQDGNLAQGEDRLNRSTPKLLANGRSLLNLPGRLELDVALFYTGASGNVDGLRDRRVAAYERLDTRLGWRPSQRFNLSLSIENILDDRHLEVVPSAIDYSSEVGRNVHLRGTFSF